MKIAFLLLAHREPAYIERLVRVLGSDGDEIFIHVDKAVDISPFEDQLASIDRFAHLIGQRYAIAWGGFNMVRATNALIEASVSRGIFDYFYLLSGQCFPIKTLSWLKQVLSGGFDHIDCQPMPQPSKPMTRLEGRQVNVKIFDFRGKRDGQKGLRFRGKRIAEAIVNLMEVPNFQTTFGLLPYAGSQWWCLKRDTIEYIRTYRQAHRKYDKFMRWTHVPDEMYYHTLVANGPTCGRITSSLTGTIWVEGEGSPEIITRSNLPSLLNRKVFLARKFQTDDSTLLDDLQRAVI